MEKQETNFDKFIIDNFGLLFLKVGIVPGSILVCEKPTVILYNYENKINEINLLEKDTLVFLGTFDNFIRNNMFFWSDATFLGMIHGKFYNILISDFRARIFRNFVVWKQDK